MNARFTLIEIVIAMAILALGLSGTLQLLTSGQSRMARAMEKWRHLHMATQAAEYALMLKSEEPELPEEFFPYPGYYARLSYEDASGLPEEYSELTETLPLKCLVVELVRERDEQVLETIRVDRLSAASSDTETSGS